MKVGNGYESHGALLPLMQSVFVDEDDLKLLLNSYRMVSLMDGGKRDEFIT